MPKKKRKRPSAQEKAAILRLHLLERTPVSDLCDQYDIHPTMFYRWQKELFENAATALEPRSRRPSDAKDRRIASLEEKLQRKNEVLSEPADGTYQTKKSLWSFLRTDCGFPRPLVIGSIQFIRHWSSRTGLAVAQLMGWLGIAASKFSRWNQRLGAPNPHRTAVDFTTATMTPRVRLLWTRPSALLRPYRRVGPAIRHATSRRERIGHGDRLS